MAEERVPAAPERELTASGRPFDTRAEHFGELAPSTFRPRLDSLRAAFEEHGYVFVPGLLPADTVLAARHEILTKYAVIGEIDDRQPLDDAVAGDRLGLPAANLRAFTQSVSTGHHFESVILHHALLDLVRDLLDAEPVPFTMRWPRLARPGEGCGFHCDGPYMNRATDRQLSAWIPLGRIAPHEGALTLLEASHRSPRLHAGYLQRDADRDGLQWLDADPSIVQEQYGQRWLTTTFHPGDVLVFNMSMLHGAFDNRADNERCRLSVDSRYYAAGETPDPRWNGDDIQPHGPGRVFYPGLGSWLNEDFQDEWKYVDERGRLQLRGPRAESAARGLSPAPEAPVRHDGPSRDRHDR